MDKSKHQVFMDTSKAEQQAGFNVSYENSFTAIKKDIYKETIQKNTTRQAKSGKQSHFEPIEEKPPTSAGSNRVQVAKKVQSKDQ